MIFENLISNALNSSNLYSKDNFIKSYEEFRKIGLKLIFIHNDYENNELFKKLDSFNKVLIKIKIDEIKKFYSYYQKYNKNIIENNNISIIYQFNYWFNDLKKINIEKYFYTNNERIMKIKPYKKNNIKIIKK
jgi:hypothetical protein